jgi:hypothetical protein
MKFFKTLSDIFTSIVEARQRQAAEALRHGNYSRWE